jgi:PAS domain S-box-containing protein
MFNDQPMNLLQSSEPQTIDHIPSRTLLEGLARVYDLVLVTDYGGRVLWVSNGLVELGGAGFQVGLDAQTILPKLPRLPKPDQVFSLRSQLRAHGHLSNIRIDLPIPDSDESVPIEVNMLPISSPADERPFFVVIARRVGASFDDAKPDPSELSSILDDAPDTLLAVDANGFVICASAAIENLLGHAPEGVINTPVAALLSSGQDLDRLMSSLGADGTVGDWELTLIGREGESVNVAASARARQNADGSFGGTVLCLRDVTERHRVVAELERKNAELEHCVHALAHDLRSPLVALLGFSRLLRQDYGGHMDDTGLHFIDRIEQAGRTMEDLIHDLLELSRIGQSGERKSLIDPKTVLSQLGAELKPRLDAGRIRLLLPSDPPLVYCDRTRLYQVFSNLIGNAIDHMGPCNDPFIQVSLTDQGDHHHITVSDSGRGIADDDHHRVFDVFQSLGPASDGRRGSGIGLAIVRKVCETHGGRVWLMNRAGGGATFHITLPHR